MTLLAAKRLDRVTALLAERERIERELASATRVAEATQSWMADGCVSGTTWLQANAAMSGAEAARRVRLARLAGRFDDTATALDDGRLPVPHGDVLATAVLGRREGFFRRDEAVLLDEAVRLPRVSDFEIVVGRWAELADQEAELRPNDRDQRLYLQGRLDGGADLRGHLDAPTAASVLAGLEAFDDGPDPVGGPVRPRTAAQRRADALGAMAEEALRRPRPLDWIQPVRRRRRRGRRPCRSARSPWPSARLHRSDRPAHVGRAHGR